MKKFAAIALVASLASTAAFAGGPVVVAEEPVVAVAGPSSSAPGIVLPLIGLAAVVALASSSSGSD